MGKYISGSLLIILFLLISQFAIADETGTKVSSNKSAIEVETYYKLKHSIEGFERFISPGEGVKHIMLKADKKSKIYVYDEKDEYYFIQMITTYRLHEKGEIEKYVEPNFRYKIKKSILENATLTKSFNFDSGTLIVPFKMRARDGSLTGDAAVGLYVGITHELWRGLEVTTLISCGISNITVEASEDQGSDSNLALTGAFGVIFRNWDKVNLGLVAGVDHIGGNTGDKWKYDDDPWVSMIISYDFD